MLRRVCPRRQQEWVMEERVLGTCLTSFAGVAVDGCGSGPFDLLWKP